jgi:hypothetical protein
VIVVAAIAKETNGPAVNTSACGGTIAGRNARGGETGCDLFVGGGPR